MEMEPAAIRATPDIFCRITRTFMHGEQIAHLPLVLLVLTVLPPTALHAMPIITMATVLGTLTLKCGHHVLHAQQIARIVPLQQLALNVRTHWELF